MNLIKCGLCGFEFERGAKICRGAMDISSMEQVALSGSLGLYMGELFGIC
ncbi:hypothetical protein [Vibrio diabolicus]|nr:hypothetical protein [Vibrio diabolicus]MCS0434615.1 hypothetical protein [Vibrio diabolicus]